ncbi:hypothetical protein J3E69DRAFT_326188 [Trichoderma sp. SZMC 28015]
MSTSGKGTAHTKIPSTERSSAKNWMKELEAAALYTVPWQLWSCAARSTRSWVPPPCWHAHLANVPKEPCPSRTVPHGTSANPGNKDRAKQGCGQKVRVGQTTESDACWIRLRQFDQGPATDRWIVGSLPPLRREETDGSAKEIMQGGGETASEARMPKCAELCVCRYTCVRVCLVDGERIDTVLYWARGQIKVLYDGYL